MKKIRFLIPVVIVLLFAMAATQVSASEGKIIVEDDPSAGVAKLFGQKTIIYYHEGACAEKCRFNQTITTVAYNRLDQVPKPYITGVYTRIPKNELGTYTVCFDTRLINHPAIWRYVGGIWVFVKGAVQADQLCANGTGDGVIGLFGYVTEPNSAPTPTPTALPKPL